MNIHIETISIANPAKSGKIIDCDFSVVGGGSKLRGAPKSVRNRKGYPDAYIITPRLWTGEVAWLKA